MKKLFFIITTLFMLSLTSACLAVEFAFTVYQGKEIEEGNLLKKQKINGLHHGPYETPIFSQTNEYGKMKITTLFLPLEDLSFTYLNRDQFFCHLHNDSRTRINTQELANKGQYEVNLFCYPREQR